MSKIFIPALCICMLGSFNIFAQQLKGKVIDSKTKEPLEMAVVKDLQSGKDFLTDRQGNFLIKNIPAADSIKISYVGYTTQTILIENNLSAIKIELEKGNVDLKDVVITSHTNNLTTSRTLSNLDLNMQPAKSAQDLLRLVPGLFIAQHQGGGKAEQIFLRGFDADHGTDVNISVDGLPVNMVSHAHGQGYADMHFVIPETIAGYDFGKGPYYANRGDFTTAGYVAFNTVNVLPNNMIKIEAGQFNTARAVAMINLLTDKAKIKGQSLYVAGEALYSDGGPFLLPEHFNRFNLFTKFITNLGSHNKLTLSLTGLTSRWRASGEIPDRALQEGYITTRFGVLDSAQGGYTTRTNATAKLVTTLRNNFTLENQVYYSHYFFNLISNFTFYYFYPTSGDEFNQHEERNMYGYNGKISHQNSFGNLVLTSVIGAGTRYDGINPSWLAHTAGGDTILNYLELGSTKELNLNAYLDETLEAGKWLFNAGLRFDYLYFNYQNKAPVSDTLASLYTSVNPNAQKSIVCPKINVQYTLNSKFQFYLKTGKGFHSNDVRIVIANQGYEILPAAYGADLGVNWKPMPHLFINTALWYLYLRQEFTYGADLGDEVVEPGGRTVRKGIDFSLRYQINNWLYTNLNADFARPRDIDAPQGDNYLPLAPTFTSTAGLDFRFKNGFNGGISYRYLHNRAANENYTLTALGYWVTDLSVNYTKKKYEIGLSIQNLFNVTWNESEFEYISQLKGEPKAVDDVSFTPGVPFFAKLKFSIFF